MRKLTALMIVVAGLLGPYQPPATTARMVEQIAPVELGPVNLLAHYHHDGRRLTRAEHRWIGHVIAWAAHAWHLDPQRLPAVASCESGWRWWVGSRFRGLFQQTHRYWRARLRSAARAYRRFHHRWPRWVRADEFDPYANAYVSAKMIHAHGYGAWPRCGRRRGW